jgi:hypothetical protein
VLTGVTDTDPADPQLLMMVLIGGKDRTLTEFRAMASAAGLEVLSAVRMGRRFVVECAAR